MKNKGLLKRDEIVEILIKKRLKEKASFYSILEYLKNDLGYKQTYAYELLREARKKIAEIYKEKTEFMIEEILSDLDEQKQEAKKNKNYRLVLEITREENKIKGAYAPEKIDMTSGGDKISEIKIIHISGTYSGN